MEKTEGLRSPLAISSGGSLLLRLWHWCFLPRLKLLSESSCVVPADDETFILAI